MKIERYTSVTPTPPVQRKIFVSPAELFKYRKVGVAPMKKQGALRIVKNTNMSVATKAIFSLVDIVSPLISGHTKLMKSFINLSEKTIRLVSKNIV